MNLQNPRVQPTETCWFEVHETDKDPELSYYGTVSVNYKQGSSLDDQWNKIILVAETRAEEMFPHLPEINWQLEYVDSKARRQIVRMYNKQK